MPLNWGVGLTRRINGFPHWAPRGEASCFVILHGQQQSEKTALCEFWNQRSIRIPQARIIQVVDRTIHSRGCSVGSRLPIDNQFPCQGLAKVFKLLQPNELGGLGSELGPGTKPWTFEKSFRGSSGVYGRCAAQTWMQQSTPWPIAEHRATIRERFLCAVL